MLFDVTVPLGCAPGDVFQLKVGTKVFDVVVPEGCGEGSKIEMAIAEEDLTEEPPPIGATPATIEVEVPTGCFPGDEFLVDTPDGQTVTVVVPEGSAPGTLLEVALPSPIEEVDHDRVPKDPRYDPSPDSIRAHLDDLEPYPLVPETPPVLSAAVSCTWDLPSPTGMCSDAAPSAIVEEPDAGPDGFDLDDQYLIQRSNGDYSEGWLKEYDAFSDMYLALIPGAGYKYVSREQIELNSVHE